MTLSSVPEVMEYRGEFGAELVLFLPFCGWLNKLGLLKDHVISTYHGMRCFYDDLDCKEIVERAEPREFVRPRQRAEWLPVKDEHAYMAPNVCHSFPDLRKKFSKLGSLDTLFKERKPLLVIHNKYNIEWEREPLNFIDEATLATLFERFSHDFNVVYFRHGILGASPGYTEDHTPMEPLNDLEVVRQFPRVSLFEDLLEAHGQGLDTNQMKNLIYSQCHRFITVQGGGAHHIAMYSGSLMLIAHRAGNECFGAYDEGYYNFMAPVPPVRMICTSPKELIAASAALEDCVWITDRIHVDAKHRDILMARSARRFCSMARAIYNQRRRAKAEDQAAAASLEAAPLETLSE